MLALIIYCYAKGVFSSRKIERASYERLSVRYLLADHHPDHNTIATFRREHLDVFKEAFVQVLLLASEMGLLKLGRVAVDGTPIKADASSSRCVRLDRAKALVAAHEAKIKQLEAQAQQLLFEAEAADEEDNGKRHDDGSRSIPADLKHHQQRRDLMKQAAARLEAQHAEAERLKQERHEEDLQRHERMGSVGRKPNPPQEADADASQISLTDEDSRWVGKPGKGVQGYNAQFTVDADGSMLIVGTHLSNNASDMGQLLAGVDAVDPRLGEVTGVLADTGYAKALDVQELEQERGLEAWVATGRGEESPYALRPPKGKGKKKVPAKGKTPKPKRTKFHPPNPVLAAMAEKRKTPEGRAVYRLRQQTVEPAIGWVKEHLGFRGFRLRGAGQVRGRAGAGGHGEQPRADADADQAGEAGLRINRGWGRQAERWAAALLGLNGRLGKRCFIATSACKLSATTIGRAIEADPAASLDADTAQCDGLHGLCCSSRL